MNLIWFAVGVIWLIVGITTNQPVFSILSIVYFVLAMQDA